MQARDSEEIGIGLLRKIFLGNKLVTEKEFQEIQRIFAENRADFIPRIVRSGYVKSGQLYRVLAKEMGLKYYDRDMLRERQELAKLFPYTYLRKNSLFPVEYGENRIIFATSNPFESSSAQHFKDLLGGKYEVKMAVSDPSTILASLEEAYREIHAYQAVKELYYRSPEESAYMVLSKGQRQFIVLAIVLFAVWFLVDYPSSFIFIFSLLNTAYFCVNPVKFYISLRGFRGSRRSLSVSNEDIRALLDEHLPSYTILIPLYKEAKVFPKLFRNIAQLDYPKEKLDVKFILEEDDGETIEEAKRLGLLGEKLRDNTVGSQRSERLAKFYGQCGKPPIGKIGYCDQRGQEILQAELPSELNYELVIVPNADIKTKPRACNYALKKATGEFCVIYDAEDDPEPDQLRKAVYGFSIVDKEVVCLQARLNFYNPDQNMITRWFALEYSYWFDYYLSGLDWVGGPIPLGGTSNQFRTEALKEVGGWDPYNVTEDADLGTRISRRKLKTAMLNSYTYEEANSNFWNWIRQRSRWNKGYVQTYLVHMRHPLKILKELGLKSFLVFQLTFGGNIFLPLVNPILWIVTILSLLFPGTLQFLFFQPIALICMINLIVGNAVYILLHMGPAILTKNKKAIPYALLIPLYWMMISLAAWRGATQLITKPFYWEKTAHGLSSTGEGISE